MKAKRFFVALTAILMAISLLPLSAIGASALQVTDKISEVDLTLEAPVSGVTVPRDNASVQVKAPMDYKVTGVSWFKNDETEPLGNMGTDTYFVGGNSYTVRVYLYAKSGNGGWNCDFKGANTDYSGIKATVNGKAATVTGHHLNPEARTIGVLYTFEMIPDKEVTPSVVIPSPLAGETPCTYDQIKAVNERALQIASTECFWYLNDGKSNDCGQGWRKLKDGECFLAGQNYRVAFTLQTKDGFIFPVGSAQKVGEDHLVSGFVNGKKSSFKLTWIGQNEQNENVYNETEIRVVYDFISCAAKDLGSVSFSGITAPEAGAMPNFTLPTVGADTYSTVTDDAVSGGAAYGFVNGVKWETASGTALKESDRFEIDVVYKMSFFVRSGAAYSFVEEVVGWANVGSAEVLRMFDDPTLAFVTVTFLPCEGEVLTDVAVGGVREPIKGEKPDYEFDFGEGFDRGGFDGDIVWYNASTDQPLSKDDVFEYGEIYELRMVLRSDLEIKGAEGRLGFAPLENLSVKVNGRETDALREYESKPVSNFVFVSVAYECGKATLNSADVTVELPVEGNAPAQKVTLAEGSLVRVADLSIIDDETAIFLGAEDRYVGGRDYRIWITLVPTEGYRISGADFRVMFDGTELNVVSYSDDHVSVLLYACAEELPILHLGFDPNGGMGYMGEILMKGGTVTLPACEFTAPEGQQFLAWSTDGSVTGAVPETITLTDHLVLYAVWESSGEHTHVYGTEFNGHDDSSHYKLCISPNCPQLGGYETMSSAPGDYMGHNWGDNTNCDSVCLDCGYVRTVNQAGEPLHFYEHDCSEICPNCGEKREAAAHTPGSAATCTDPQSCTVCGKRLAEALGHTLGEGANCAHGALCGTCGVELGAPVGEHIPGEEPTCTEGQKCTVCGTELKPANGHTAGVEWISDKDGHHKLCACGAKVEEGTHTNEDGDKLCDTCGYKVGKGSTSGGSGEDPKKGLPVGAVIGIIVGAVVLLGGGGFCLYLFVLREKLNKNPGKKPSKTPSKKSSKTPGKTTSKKPKK